MNDIKVLPFTDGQKEVIEATKKICNGKKVCDVDDDIDVLTNEEYIRTCSTEELARLIYKIAVTDVLLDRFFTAEMVNAEIVDVDSGIKEAEVWLKEKHE